jgi:hypothetical protein
MNRNSLMEMSGRAMHSILRLTLNKANDNPMMQELSFDGMNSEGRKIVERLQAFGMTTMPLPRDQQQGGGQNGGGGGGTGGDGASMQGPAAEGIALLIGGQRNHPVVIGVDDRRHRPMGLKPGESFQYDDQQQGTLIRRAATYILSLDDDGSGQAPAAVMLRDAEGRETGQSQKQERFVSLRHVVKKKQSRDQGNPQANLKSWADAGVDLNKLSADELAEKASAPNNEDYKHEGDTVNTEVRANKSKVEFRTGDTAVGHYDKDAKEWQLTSSGDASKSVVVTDQHAHIKIGGNSIFVDSGGCWSTQPIQIKGDPTAARGDGPTWMERIEQLEARVKELEARYGI